MLLQPTNVSPSLYLGDGGGVIDASQENIFSSTINGNAPVVAYQCVIFKNNATNDIVFDSGIIALDEPFYGADYSGNIVLFEYTVPSNSPSHTPHTTMENGYIYGYKHVLKLWWDLDTNNYEANSIISYEYVFKARAQATISINPFTVFFDGATPVVKNRKCVWGVTYNQANNVGINWFRWTLALASDKASVVKQTNRIYTNSSIKFQYDGLTTGIIYSIRAEAQTQDGVIIYSDWVDFIVDYEMVSVDSAIEISQTEYGIKLDWGNLQFIEGVPNNYNWQYVENRPVQNSTCVEVSLGTNITFTSSEHFNVAIPLTGDQYWSAYFREDSSELYYASGTDDNGDPYYIKLSHSGSAPGLFPSDVLYPSDTLYPTDNDGGYFELDINGESSYIAYTGYPEQYWFVVKMNTSGMQVFEIPYVYEVS